MRILEREKITRWSSLHKVGTKDVKVEKFFSDVHFLIMKF